MQMVDCVCHAAENHVLEGRVVAINEDTGEHTVRFTMIKGDSDADGGHQEVHPYRDVYGEWA